MVVIIRGLVVIVCRLGVEWHIVNGRVEEEV